MQKIYRKYRHEENIQTSVSKSEQTHLRNALEKENDEFQIIEVSVLERY